MHLKHVLQRVPGLNRRFIYYLEAQGYIQPTHVPKSRIDRRDYSEKDLHIIQETWKYYQRGFSLHTAYTFAMQRDRVITVATFQVSPKQRLAFLEGLKQVPEVVEAAAIYAETADFIVKFSTPQEADVYQVLVPLFAKTGLSGAPGLLRIAERFAAERKPSRKKETSDMMAYVLMKVPSKNVAEVMSALKRFPGVLDAGTVYGELDVIARVEVPSQKELDTLVMEKIHSIPAVESTRTYIVVGNTYWSRVDGER